MVLVLTSITCISGAILGAVNGITTEPIAKAKQAKQENAIKTVAPEFNNNPVAEAKKVTLEDGTEATIFPAKENGELVGAAVQSVSKNGFGGIVTIMVGFEKDGTIKEYTVLSHSETPGLGSKMPVWFHEKGNILGKNPGTNNLTVSKDGGEIDAITAATISSRAFLGAVQNAYKAFCQAENTNNQVSNDTAEEVQTESAETNEEEN